MNFRRKPVRQRDIVSFGRRTPRFNLLALRGAGTEMVEDQTVIENLRAPTNSTFTPANRTVRSEFENHLSFS